MIETKNMLNDDELDVVNGGSGAYGTESRPTLTKKEEEVINYYFGQFVSTGKDFAYAYEQMDAFYFTKFNKIRTGLGEPLLTHYYFKRKLKVMWQEKGGSLQTWKTMILMLHFSCYKGRLKQCAGLSYVIQKNN